MLSTIEKYLNGLASDEFHRYRSWDNCYQSFNDSVIREIHILELAFYLASWGMYRGSSGLLQKNHLIHKGAVEIIFSNEGQKLRCSERKEITKSDIIDIVRLKDRLASHYTSISFKKSTGLSKPISPTDTLITKVMLGTLGCVPAYDRYFICGLKVSKMRSTSFSEASLSELVDFVSCNEKEVVIAQKIIKEKINRHYPVMKIIDMYFWQLGYDNGLKDLG